jgi:hypothetical protein
VRRRPLYRTLAVVCLALAATMAALAAVAAAFGQALSAAAAGLCAGVLVVPGLIFFNQSYRLYLRNVALSHVSSIVERDGGTEVAALAQELGIPETDADRILQKAVKEGYARGEFDGKGRFLPAATLRCPSCARVAPTASKAEYCDACGARLRSASP